LLISADLPPRRASGFVQHIGAANALARVDDFTSLGLFHAHQMKAKAAATVILLYSILLFLAAVCGAVLNRDISITTILVSGVICIGPAIGIYRRANWCRIFLGICFALVLAFFLVLPFTEDEFHFRLTYLAFLAGSGFPVFLLFFYPPLRHYTRNVAPSESKA
jgi:hypothetical protein